MHGRGRRLWSMNGLNSSHNQHGCLDGEFCLPRLYVYHVSAAPGSELSETLKVMERRLFRAIIDPAMISTFVFGIWMLA